MSQPSSSSRADPSASRDAIAAAIQARLGGTSKDGVPQTGAIEEARRRKEEDDHLLKLRRIIDLQIRRDNSYEKAAECLKVSDQDCITSDMASISDIDPCSMALQTLDTIIGNILTHPEDPKYRSFKSENKRIQSSLLSLSGGSAYLLQAGFGTRTVDFKQEWYISSSMQPPSASPSTSSSQDELRWRKLQLASKVIKEKLGDSQDRADRQKERDAIEKEVEKNRAARVLAEAQEDRERVAQRAARERRIAKEKQDKGAAGVEASTSSPPARRSATYDGSGNFQASTRTAIEPPGAFQDAAMDGEEGQQTISREDFTREIPFDEPSHRGQEEDEDVDEQGERPPPYGMDQWGTGRRLGD